MNDTGTNHDLAAQVTVPVDATPITDAPPSQPPGEPYGDAGVGRDAKHQGDNWPQRFRVISVTDALQATTLVGAISYAYSWYAITMVFSRFGLTAEDAGYGFSALLVRVTPVMGLALAAGLLMVALSRTIDRSVGEFVGGILEDGPVSFPRILGVAIGMIGLSMVLVRISTYLPGNRDLRLILGTVPTVLIGAVAGFAFYVGFEWSDRRTIADFWKEAPGVGLVLSIMSCLPIVSLNLADWRVRSTVAAAASLLLALAMTIRRKGHLGWLIVFAATAGGAMLIGDRAWSIPGCALLALTILSFVGVLQSDELNLRLNQTSESHAALVAERHVRRLGALIGVVAALTVAIGGPIYLGSRVEHSVRQGIPVDMPHRAVPLLTIKSATLLKPDGVTSADNCVLVLGHDGALLSVLVPQTGQILRLPLETTMLVEPCT